MNYDEAVEAATEALSRLWVEGGFASNDELARAAIDAALPHLRDDHDRTCHDLARDFLAAARDAGWQGRINEMLERLEQVQSTWGFPVEQPVPTVASGGRLYTEQEVGDLQAREAELVSRPLREKIAHLEQRALKAEAALADAKREGAIEALEEAAEVIPGSDSGIGAVDPYDLAADWLARCAARLREGQ